MHYKFIREFNNEILEEGYNRPKNIVDLMNYYAAAYVIESYFYPDKGMLVKVKERRTTKCPVNDNITSL